MGDRWRGEGVVAVVVAVVTAVVVGGRSKA